MKIDNNSAVRNTNFYSYTKAGNLVVLITVLVSEEKLSLS